MAQRCDLCSDFSISSIREASHPSDYVHHSSLLELKLCADSGKCDICTLFWTSLSRDTPKVDLEHYLQGRPNDPPDCRSTVIKLTAFLQDLQPDNGFYMGRGRSHIQVGSGENCYAPGTTTNAVFETVSVFAKEDTFAGGYLFERNTMISPDPELQLRLAQRWVKSCMRKHPQCGGELPMTMPTRVIDLGPDDGSENQTPKLLESNGKADCYVALSYSWGLNVRHKVVLKKASLSALQKEIPESLMTLSHREALRVTRKLGYRYLWIDALCIIQDDKEDWAREAVKMCDVYGNAHVTIVAGRSGNSLDGFLQYRSKSPLLYCPISYIRPDMEGPRDSLCYLGLSRSTRTGPVDDRAWCFQESVLSRRMIVFGQEQVHFQCRVGWVSEDGNSNYLWDCKANPDVFEIALSKQHLSRDAILTRWYHLSHAFSTRDMFDPLDNFATLSGIAVRFQEALQCRFLAGLWEDDMVCGLLWRSRRLYGGPHSRTPLRVPRGVKEKAGIILERAPTWSWLALQGPIWPEKGYPWPRKAKNTSGLRCRPFNRDGRTWTRGDWNPRIVKDFPLPLKLEVLGSPRKVQLSATSMREYGQKPKKWTYGREKFNKLVKLLEPEESPGHEIVAAGFFDLAEGNPTCLWAMCLTSDEGLLLDQNTERDNDGDKPFRRIGIFAVEDDSWFQTGSEVRVTIV